MGDVISLEGALAIRDKLRARGKTVVFTNGHFDLLHVGHVNYLQKARELGDALIVGLNSDASTWTLKGKKRPIVPQSERARMLAALACVDYVIIFEETTAIGLVEALKPDLYVKGGDWGGGHPPPEAKVVVGYGGTVCTLPYLPGHSTTLLIEKIRGAKTRRTFCFKRDLFDRQRTRDLLEAALVVLLSSLYIPVGILKGYLNRNRD